MKRFPFLIVMLALLGVSAPLAAQTDAIQGWCETGGKTVSTQGLTSITTVQQSYPRCTVTVYLTGTTTLATIYKDKVSTPLANPFTANTDGSWLFFAVDTSRYDVTMSGGTTPNVFPIPFTLTDLGNSSGGGGTGCVLGGTLTPDGQVIYNAAGSCASSPNIFVPAPTTSQDPVGASNELVFKNFIGTSTDDQINLDLESAVNSGSNNSRFSPHLWQMTCTNSGRTALGCQIELTVNDSGRTDPTTGGLTPILINMEEDKAGSHPHFAGIEIDQVISPGIVTSASASGILYQGPVDRSSTFGNVYFLEGHLDGGAVSTGVERGVYLTTTAGNVIGSNYCDFIASDSNDANLRESLGCGPTYASTFYGPVLMPTGSEVDGSAICTQATGCPGGGGGSGFPITIGSTSVIAGSTNTALTGLSVNGVTLQSGGSSSLFLTQAGTYAAAGGGSGTVTSVGLSLPAMFSVTGSPVTTSGTLAATLSNQSANAVFAGPATGSPATPAFRALVAADLPLATTGAFGAVKPDGTTITISAGVISSTGTGGGISGQTTGYLPLATSATTSTISSALQDTGSTLVYHGTGTAHGITLPEGTAISAVAGSDILYADATAHCLQYSVNGGSFSCLGTGGGGNTTSTSLTTNFLTKANGANSIINSLVSESGGALNVGEPMAVTDGTGNGGIFDATEGTAPSATALHDILYADSTSHCMMYSSNGGAFSCLGTGGGGGIPTSPSNALVKINGSGGAASSLSDSGTALSGTEPLTLTTTGNVPLTVTSSSTANTAFVLSNSNVTGEWIFEELGTASPAGMLFFNFFNASDHIPIGWDKTTLNTRLNGSSVLGWTSGSPISTSLDTGISRDSAGVVDVGNGTAGDASGTIKAANATITNLTVTSCTGCGAGGGTVTGSGTSGYLSKWTSTSAIGNSALDFGVGTAGAFTADAGASSNSFIVKSSSTASTALTINNTTVAGGGYTFFVGGSANGFPGSFGLYNYATTHQPFTIKSNDDALFTGTVNTSAGQAFTWNADTGISRNAAGVVYVGNGTSGDSSGTIKAAVGTLPVYSASGTAQTNSHVVTGSATLSSGTLAVTLSGSASFTSSSSYTCTANDTTATNAVRLTYASGTSFTLTGTGTDVIQYVCVGN